MEFLELIDLNNLARSSIDKTYKKRFAYDDIFANDGKHSIGIVGARGVGKTTLLKQFLNENTKSFYISMDTFSGDLFSVIKKLISELEIEVLLLDEVHFYKGFESVLKKVYDFLDIKVIFTGSVALALFESSYDLSRRVILKTLYPFSFREYLWFKHDERADSISMESFLANDFNRDLLNHYTYFKEYLSGGLMPFALGELKPLAIIKNILQTIINKDAAVVGRLAPDEIQTLTKMVAFIAKSQVDGLNYTSLSNNLKITKYKAMQYVSLLEKAFVLHCLEPVGTNVMKEPKILLSLPYRLLYSEYDNSIGALREDFFVETMKMLGMKVNYLKSTRGKKTPDFVLSNFNSQIAFEIGGKGKGREQFKGIDIKNKIVLADSIENKGIKRSLFCVGFLEKESDIIKGSL